MVRKKEWTQNGFEVFVFKARRIVAWTLMSTVTMFAKFGNFFKKGRTQSVEVPPFSAAPHGPREERLIAAICEEVAQKLLATTRAGEGATWSPEEMNVSGIVLCATDDEVCEMISARVAARVRHYAETDRSGHRITVSPSLGLMLTGDEAIAVARQEAVSGMSDGIHAVAEGISTRIAAVVCRDGAAAYDLASFSPHRSLSWPLEGWDRDSLRVAGEAVMGRVRRNLEEAGMTVVLRNGKFEVADKEPEPTL